ncbi:MAG: ankyrin repeat domain-containing protein, partial [Spirochaetaceae bacterium]|nr:ankyrin repeat domain-containing protein [Spirochaetaceae bacterium]
FTGIHLTETDNEGRSVLHMAVAMEAATDTLKVLLDAGALPNLRDFKGETALHYAVSGSIIPQATTLLDYDADPFLENNEGITPLIQAFDQGPEITIGFLSGRIDIQDRWGNTPLFHSVHWKHPIIVEALLSAGADPRHKNRQESTVLHEAVHTNSLETASLLIDAGSDPNARDDLGHTPFHEAVTWGTFEILRLLTERGAQKDARDNTGQTALHMAAFAGNDEIAEWLLSSGASPDVRDNNGQSPLFIAAESDRVNTAKLLLDNGASLLMRDNNGRTALHIAVAGGRASSSMFLIKSGSDLFAVDGSGKTPFDLAMESGTAFMSALMDHNLVNRQDNMGNTPLHIAVISNADETIVRILLEKGADRLARNASGKTPSDLAGDMGDEVIAALVK